MADLLTDKGPPKREEPPEPKGGKAPPQTWAQRLKIRQYRAAMRFAGYEIGEEVTEKEFKQAHKDYKKVPGNWYLNPDKYLKKKVVK